MMGELFASQVHATIAKTVENTGNREMAVYVGNKGVGKYLKTEVFEPGRSLSWNELTKHATGQGLNAKAFAEDFKN